MSGPRYFLDSKDLFLFYRRMLFTGLRIVDKEVMLFPYKYLDTKIVSLGFYRRFPLASMFLETHLPGVSQVFLLTPRLLNSECKDGLGVPLPLFLKNQIKSIKRTWARHACLKKVVPTNIYSVIAAE